MAPETTETTETTVALPAWITESHAATVAQQEDQRAAYERERQASREAAIADLRAMLDAVLPGWPERLTLTYTPAGMEGPRWYMIRSAAATLTAPTTGVVCRLQYDSDEGLLWLSWTGYDSALHVEVVTGNAGAAEFWTSQESPIECWRQVGDGFWQAAR